MQFFYSFIFHVSILVPKNHSFLGSSNSKIPLEVATLCLSAIRMDNSQEVATMLFPLFIVHPKVCCFLSDDFQWDFHILLLHNYIYWCFKYFQFHLMVVTDFECQFDGIGFSQINKVAILQCVLFVIHYFPRWIFKCNFSYFLYNYVFSLWILTFLIVLNFALPLFPCYF